MSSLARVLKLSGVGTGRSGGVEYKGPSSLSDVDVDYIFLSYLLCQGDHGLKWQVLACPRFTYPIFLHEL